MDGLIERGWEKKQCAKTNRIYYQKPKHPHPELSTGKEYFKSLGKIKKCSLESLLDDLHMFHVKKSNLLHARNVLNTENDTVFIGAGLQILLNMVKEGALPRGIDSEPFYLAQPCFRADALEKVEINGYSSSFVNVCTETFVTSSKMHLDLLDHWFDFFSKQGLYMGHFTLLENPDWGNEQVKGQSLLVYYGDLQIGDAVVVESTNPQSQEPILISDLGFGLERIAWALQKTRDYYETIGPIVSVKSEGIIPTDLIRTLALLSHCGVKSSYKGAGSAIRKIVKKYLECKGNPYPLHELNRYCEFWNGVLQNKVPVAKTVTQVLNEIHGEYIKAMSEKYSITGITLNSNSCLETFLKDNMHRFPEGFVETYLRKGVLPR